MTTLLLSIHTGYRQRNLRVGKRNWGEWPSIKVWKKALKTWPKAGGNVFTCEEQNCTSMSDMILAASSHYIYREYFNPHEKNYMIFYKYFCNSKKIKPAT